MTVQQQAQQLRHARKAFGYDEKNPRWLVTYGRWSKIVGLNTAYPSYIYEYPEKCKWERLQ